MPAQQTIAPAPKRSIARLGFLLPAVVLAFLSLGSAASAADESAAGAKHFIESIGSEAQTILRSDGIGSDEKVASIQKLLQDSVDLKASGRMVLGAAWRRASEAQRREYNELFANYVLQIYPRALLQHQKEQFTVIGSTRPADQDTLVYSQIREPDGARIDWTWRVREDNGSYKVVDLLANGVSMTSTLREEFNSYVFHHGVDGLLAKLRRHGAAGTDPE